MIHRITFDDISNYRHRTMFLDTGVFFGLNDCNIVYDPLNNVARRIPFYYFDRRIIEAVPHWYENYDDRYSHFVTTELNIKEARRFLAGQLGAWLEMVGESDDCVLSIIEVPCELERILRTNTHHNRYAAKRAEKIYHANLGVLNRIPNKSDRVWMHYAQRCDSIISDDSRDILRNGNGLDRELSRMGVRCYSSEEFCRMAELL